MSLVIKLLLLVACARLLGRLSKSLGSSEILGEVIAGVLLGPAILNIVEMSQELKGVVELGVFFLLFSAGLEMDWNELVGALKKRTLLAALFGFVLPFTTGAGLGFLFELGRLQSVCIGLVFSVTALPVVFRMLDSFRLLGTAIGHQVIGAVVIIDILALMTLGIVFDTGRSAPSLWGLAETVGLTSVKMLLFFLIVFFVNKFLRFEFTQVLSIQQKFRQLIAHLGEEAVFGIAVLFVLIFSSVSEFLGLHFIIGAFFGGLLLNRDIIGSEFYDSLDHVLNSISSGFLTPIFFACIGMQLKTQALENYILLALFIVSCFVAKTFGVWLGARLGGVASPTALRMGVLMNGRGVLDLVVADLALSRGYLTPPVFSMLVILGIVTSVLSPLIYSTLPRPTTPGTEDF